VTAIKAAVWKRVSTDHQDADNQDAALAQFCAHHGYTPAATFTLSDSAWKDGQGGPEYRQAIRELLDGAWRGEYSAVLVWSLDRITRLGAEDALRLIRQLRERGAVLVSVQESWLSGSPEIADMLVSFAAWVAQQESTRRSERIKAALAAKKARGEQVGGRKLGSRDRKPRATDGYVMAWQRRKAAVEVPSG
jgi:DNA invertase Pin-like site-specific DNA recombinase